MKNTHEIEDAEANQFAMCLLVPEDLLRAEVKRFQRDGAFDLCDDAKMKKLADRFKVSVTVLAIRIGQVYGKIIC